MQTTPLDYARHCWQLLQRLPDQHRESELITIMRLLAECGETIDKIPATADEIRAALKSAPRTIKDGASYWADAQHAFAIDDLWLSLGLMEAALILDSQDHAAIGVTDALISGLIRKYRKP